MLKLLICMTLSAPFAKPGHHSGHVLSTMTINTVLIMILILSLIIKKKNHEIGRLISKLIQYLLPACMFSAQQHFPLHEKKEAIAIAWEEEVVVISI